LAAHKGFKVFIGARNVEKGKAAIEKLKQESGNGEAEFVQLEITDVTSVENAVKHIQSVSGKLDILINNAGIGHMDKYDQQQISNLNIALIRDCMETNFYGTVNVSQAFHPLLKKSALPVVVFVSSDMASTTVMARPGSFIHSVAYNTSKAALNSYLASYAHAFPEAKVNAVTPGYTSTKLNGFSGPKSAADGAAIIVKYALLDKDGPTSKFFDENGEYPW